MKKILTLISFFFCAFSYAQEVQIIEHNADYVKEKTVKEFEFIDNDFDLTDYEKVAVLKGCTVSSGKNTLVKLYKDFKKTSNEFGANAYKIDMVKKNSDTIHIQISSYYFDEKAFEDNFMLYPKNMVYIFGDLDVKNLKAKKVKLNGQKMELPSFEYISYQNEVGEYATVSVGGVTGHSVRIQGKEGRLPEYLSLKGFGLAPSFGYGGGMGISLSTGRIYDVDMDFGQFLINILTKKIM